MAKKIIGPHDIIDLTEGQKFILNVPGVFDANVTLVSGMTRIAGCFEFDWHHAYPDQYRTEHTDFEDIDLYLSERSHVIIRTVEQIFGATYRDDLRTDGLAFELYADLSNPLTIAQATHLIDTMISSAQSINGDTLHDQVAAALVDYDQSLDSEA